MRTDWLRARQVWEKRRKTFYGDIGVAERRALPVPAQRCSAIRSADARNGLGQEALADLGLTFAQGGDFATAKGRLST